MSGFSGLPLPLCLQLTNSSSAAVSVALAFVDAQGTTSCQDASHTESFGQYVSLSGKTVTLSGNTQTNIHAALQFPKTITGIVNGCITYSVGTTDATQSLFNINVRKAQFVSVFLRDTLTQNFGLVNFSNQNQVPHNLSNNPYMLASIDPVSKKVTLEVGLVNRGNITEQVTVQSTLSSPLGLHEVLSGISKTIEPQQTVYVTQSFDQTPVYGGPLTVDTTISHQGDATDLKIITQSANLFIVPWEWIIGVLIVLVLLLTILKMKSPDDVIYPDNPKEKK